MQLSSAKRFAFTLIVTVFLLIFLIAALLPARRTKFVWGSTAIIGNKYWSAAVKEMGLDSVTIMSGSFGINQSDDFDRYFPDFVPAFVPGPLRYALGSCLALVHVLRNARVVHTTFWGFALGATSYWRLERLLFALAGIRTVFIPFGSDANLSSQIIDPSVRYAVLAAYPQLARDEEIILRKVRYWSRHADIVLTGYAVDGLGRWDVTLNQFYVIDTRHWFAKGNHSGNDGTNGLVRILHNPNHRGSKGTEFVIDAVERLRSEGLKVELVLAEKVPNQRIREMMQEVDVHADQFIYSGYATSAIEAMSSGLPVLANLHHEAYTRVFRRYAFLDECPILSTTPESLYGNLRLLVTHPELRRRLGAAGRDYAEKYHSLEMAQYLFGSIYAKILDGKDVDLLNLFHPLTSAFNRRRARVDHPLIDSRLPPNWMPDGAQEPR